MDIRPQKKAVALNVPQQSERVNDGMLNSDVDLHCGNVRHVVCLRYCVAGAGMSDNLRAAAQAALSAMKLAREDHGTIMLAYPAIESWLYHNVDQRLDDAIKAVEDALAEPAEIK